LRTGREGTRTERKNKARKTRCPTTALPRRSVSKGGCAKGRGRVEKRETWTEMGVKTLPKKTPPGGSDPAGGGVRRRTRGHSVSSLIPCDGKKESKAHLKRGGWPFPRKMLKNGTGGRGTEKPGQKTVKKGGGGGIETGKGVLWQPASGGETPGKGKKGKKKKPELEEVRMALKKAGACQKTTKLNRKRPRKKRAGRLALISKPKPGQRGSEGRGKPHESETAGTGSQGGAK